MSEEKVLTKKELESALFSAADALRSKMDANEYKNYLLGIIFYKYLSDKMLYHGDCKIVCVRMNDSLNLFL